MTLSASTSERLAKWAEVVTSINQNLDNPAALSQVLVNGAREMLGAEIVALVKKVEQDIVEIGALVGLPSVDAPLIETVLSGNSLGGQFKIAHDNSPLAQCYFDRRNVFVDQLPTSGSNFAASLALQEALQKTLNLRSWWILPLSASTDDECLGMLILGRSTVTPPTADDQLFASTFVAQAALAIKHNQRDPLTEAGQQMAEAASASLNLVDVVERVLVLATQLIVCDSAALFLRYGDVMRVYAVYKLPQELIGSEFDLLNPLLDKMLATRSPIYFADVQGEDRFIHLFNQPHIRSWLAAPLVVGERVIGQVSFYSKQSGRFVASDARLLDVLSRQAALALENAQLYHEATRHLQQMAILNEISTAAVSALDFNEAMRQVMWALKRTLRYETVDLWLVNESQDRLLLVTPEFGGTAKTLRFGEGVSGKVAASGTAARIDDVRQHPNAKTDIIGAGSEVCAPIRIGARVIGVIDVRSSRLSAFNDDDVYVLSIVGGQLAHSLENVRLYELQRRRTEETVALLDISETISSSLELSDVLNEAAKQTIAACHVPLCVILLATDTATHFRLGSHALETKVMPPPDWEALTHLLQKHPIEYFPNTTQSFTSGQTQVVEPNGPLSTFLASMTLQKIFLYVPLRISDRSVGMMVLGDRDAAREFDARQVSLAAAIGRQLAVAVENAHLYARTQQNVRDLSSSLDQLKQTQAQLVQSGKLAAVGQLAAGVAHEINNPLTTISGFSEIVLRELPDDSPLKNDLNLILHEAQRARDVVRRLLDFARQSEPHRDSADLNALVHDTVTLMRNAAAVRSVNIKEDYAVELAWVSIDVNQFKQVVLNLLNNAVQAMPKGGVLTISTGAQDRDGKFGLWIKVTDTGVGIPLENLERIFEPFFTTKPPDEGTGLGLAVSYRIVREHEGVIEVSSEEGVGTTFTIWIPNNL